MSEIQPFTRSGHGERRIRMRICERKVGRLVWNTIGGVTLEVRLRISAQFFLLDQLALLAAIRAEMPILAEVAAAIGALVLECEAA